VSVPAICNKNLHFSNSAGRTRCLKKTYVVQLFTEQGSIAKEVEAEDVVTAVRAFVILVGYRKGETISIAEM
jgi:hypothetical protein